MQNVDTERDIISKKHKWINKNDLNDAGQTPAGIVCNRRHKMLQEKSQRQNTDEKMSARQTTALYTKQGKTLKEKPKNRRDRKNSLPLITTGCISTFVLLIVTILIYDVVINFLDVVDFQALKTELADNVHNQSDALSVISDSLDKIENHDKVVSVVNFVGSTGVGKTFISNIIKRHFYQSLQETRGPLKVITGQRILSTIQQSRSRYNLVIVDDLTVDDIDDLLVFIKELPQDVVVLVICIFTIQETDNSFNHKINYDHIGTIENKFTTAGISHEMAKFHEFSKEQARAWVVKQLIKKDIDIELHSKIINSVLDNHNVKYHGLKGLSSKLNVEL